MSPQKSEEGDMIDFCQKQSFADVLQNRCSQKLHRFHRKKTVLESLLNKFATLKLCNFIKKRLQHKCFPVKFHKFLRAPFFTEHVCDCFWKGSVKELV